MHPLLTSYSWDDWVAQDRLKKFTEENRELASTLRREVEASLRRPSKPSARRRTGGSDRDSARGSEERQSSAPRGTKRNRDSEIEKVSPIGSTVAITSRRHLTLAGGQLLRAPVGEDCPPGQLEIPPGR